MDVCLRELLQLEFDHPYLFLKCGNVKLLVSYEVISQDGLWGLVGLFFKIRLNTKSCCDCLFFIILLVFLQMFGADQMELRCGCGGFQNSPERGENSHQCLRKVTGELPCYILNKKFYWLKWNLEGSHLY